MWSNSKDGPWTPFESFCFAQKLLEPVFKETKGTDQRPPTLLKRTKIWEVEESIKKRGPSGDVRLRSTLEEIKHLLKTRKSGGSVYLCDAKKREFLDSGNEAIRWSEKQRANLGSLRELLHPKCFDTSGDDLPEGARVVQMVFFSDKPKREISDLERSVLWRVSHLYPVLAFCELIIALGDPSDGSDNIQSVPGAVVAAKSALELAVHFVSGGTSCEFDPFDDATKFGYAKALETLGEKDVKWSEASRWYAALCESRNESRDDHKAMSGICDNVLQLVLGIREFRDPIQIPAEEKLVVEDFDESLKNGFKPPAEPYVVLTYRVNSEKGQFFVPKTIDRAMSWTGFDSPRLQALGFDQVKSFDSPVLVDMTDLMAKMVSLTTSTAVETANAKGPLCTVMSLIQAFCICKNLGNFLALGAIARQLHLQVEKLTEAVGLCVPYEEKRANESEADWAERKPCEDDKSLKCIGEKLESLSTPSQDLNLIRRSLQDVLASFAHPGWLVRTELLQTQENQGLQALFMTANYTPRTLGGCTHDDLKGVYIPVVIQVSLETSHFEFLINRFPESLRTALTGQPDGQILTGSAFDIPLVAFYFCKLALEVVCKEMK